MPTAAEPSEATSRARLGWLGVLAVVGLLVYAASLGIGYYDDDWQCVYQWPPHSYGAYLTQTYPRGMYRPLEALWLGLVQSHLGLATWPVHLPTVAAHIALACLVYLAMVDLGLSTLAARLGSLLLLLNPSAVFAVCRGGTISQVMGSLLGSLAVWLAWKWLRAPTDAPNRRLVGGLVGALALALLFKESSVAYVPLCWLIVFAAPGAGSAVVHRRRAQVVLLTAATAVGYLALRHLAMAISPPPTGNPEFKLGANLLRNIVMLLTFTTDPWPSIGLYDAAWRADVGALLGHAVSTAVVAGACLWGGLAQLGVRRSAVLLCAALLATFPMVLMPHIHELYAYPALPFLAVVGGCGLAHWVQRAGEGRLRPVAWALVAVLFAVQGTTVERKIVLMRRCGAAAAPVLAQALAGARQVPPRGSLVLAFRDTGEPSFSAYRPVPSRTLWDGQIVRFLAGRPDLTVRPLSLAAAAGASAGADSRPAGALGQALRRKLARMKPELDQMSRPLTEAELAALSRDPHVVVVTVAPNGSGHVTTLSGPR